MLCYTITLYCIYLCVSFYGHVISSDGAEYQTGEWLINNGLKKKMLKSRVNLTMVGQKHVLRGPDGNHEKNNVRRPIVGVSFEIRNVSF